MTIQLHRLEGFYWVSRHEGYAEAARNFPYPITQPAVHQQVKKLEGELGCKLFERVAKDRVRHTSEGRRLYDFCAPFFEELPAVVRALKARDYGGELRIDGVGLTIRNLLPSWIRKLHEKHPNIRVVLREVYRPDLDRLRTGEADLIIDTVDAAPKGIGRIEVATAHAFLVLPSDHPGARRKRPGPTDLTDEPFVAYPPDTRHYDLQMRGLERLGIAPGPVLSAPSAESILSFVTAGLGFSLIPWLDKSGPEWAGVVAKRLTGSGTQFPIHAVWRQGPSENPLVEAALDTAPIASKRR